MNEFVEGYVCMTFDTSFLLIKEIELNGCGFIVTEIEGRELNDEKSACIIVFI